MIQEHIKYLRCPKTLRVLELESELIENGSVKQGVLIEPISDNKYPIVNFIPRFIGSNNYADNFGFEWNKHNRTQFDESSGFNVSKERFVNETRWEKDLSKEVILEAGSGSGRFTKHAIETGAMIISFDYSNAVEANFKSNGHTANLLIVQADIFEIPFPELYFDRIFCFGVLQHTPDPRKAFSSLVTALKNGGYLSTDIYLKSIGKVLLTPKYLLRKLTKKMNPEKLYDMVVSYINFIWPLVKVIRNIPKLGKKINWRLMVADYSELLTNADDAVLKEWAILDTYDMLSPAYDYPQTLKSFKRWHMEENLLNIEVHYGYNGIEGRAKKSN